MKHPDFLKNTNICPRGWNVFGLRALVDGDKLKKIMSQSYKFQNTQKFVKKWAFL